MILCVLEHFFQFPPTGLLPLVTDNASSAQTNQTTCSWHNRPLATERRATVNLTNQLSWTGMESGQSIPCSSQQTVRLANTQMQIHANPSKSNIVTVHTPCKNSLSVGIVSCSAAYWLLCRTAGMTCSITCAIHNWAAHPGLLNLDLRHWGDLQEHKGKWSWFHNGSASFHTCLNHGEFLFQKNVKAESIVTWERDGRFHTKFGSHFCFWRENFGGREDWFTTMVLVQRCTSVLCAACFQNVNNNTFFQHQGNHLASASASRDVFSHLPIHSTPNVWMWDLWPCQWSKHILFHNQVFEWKFQWGLFVVQHFGCNCAQQKCVQPSQAQVSDWCPKSAQTHCQNNCHALPDQTSNPTGNFFIFLLTFALWEKGNAVLVIAMKPNVTPNSIVAQFFPGMDPVVDQTVWHIIFHWCNNHNFVKKKVLSMCHLRSKSTVMAQFSAKGQGRGAFFAIRCNCKLCMLPPWHFVEWFSGCCTMQLSTWVVLQQNPSVNSECFECAKLHKQCDSGWKVNTSRQNAGCTNDHWNFSRQNEPHWTKTTAKSAPHCQNLSDAPIDCKAKTIGAIFWNHLLWQKKVPNRKHLSRNECSSSQTPIPAPTSTLTHSKTWMHGNTAVSHERLVRPHPQCFPSCSETSQTQQKRMTSCAAIICAGQPSPELHVRARRTSRFNDRGVCGIKRSLNDRGSSQMYG